ncbi:MAG TPA: glycosyltransferase family 39 protein [Candidatus Polarisedimenticolaceae bacterium]
MNPSSRAGAVPLALPRSRPALASGLLLTALTLGVFLPFLGKAVHIDDPLFVWTARQILSDPTDFYGFTLNWQGVEEPMSEVTQNPPLAAYYLALVGWLFGWSERAMHAGFLLPALLAVLGTYRLAHVLGTDSMRSAIATLAAPVFVVSGTSLMGDMMLLASWVWAIALWIEGLRLGNATRLGFAALLVAAAALTKYFGISLVPLLFVVSWMETGRLGRWTAILLLPVAALVGYQALTESLYGTGLLGNAAAYASDFRVGGGLLSKAITGLAFSGGCIVLLLTAAPLLWGKRALLFGIPAAGVVGAIVVAMRQVGEFHVTRPQGIAWSFVAQVSLLVVAGTGLLVLAVADWRRRRSADSVLLLLWVGGTLAFTCLVNWTVSARNLLPLVPAASLLVVRRLESSGHVRDRAGRARVTLAVGASLAVALLVAWADYALAGSARTAARSLVREPNGTSNAFAFQGHWGFQYYMQELGARPLDRDEPRYHADEAVVVPVGNSYLFPVPAERRVSRVVHAFRTLPGLTTMSARLGAGFYSDGWGPLPFAFGRIPAEEYVVYRMR